MIFAINRVFNTHAQFNTGKFNEAGSFLTAGRGMQGPSRVDAALAASTRDTSAASARPALQHVTSDISLSTAKNELCQSRHSVSL